MRSVKSSYQERSLFYLKTKAYYIQRSLISYLKNLKNKFYLLTIFVHGQYRLVKSKKCRLTATRLPQLLLPSWRKVSSLVCTLPKPLLCARIDLHLATHTHTHTHTHTFCLFKRLYLFIFREGKGEKKRGRETSLCG